MIGEHVVTLIPDPASPGGPIKDTANTHLVAWNGQLLATWWLSGRPMALTVPDLDTGSDGPVVISLPATRCTAPVIAQLKEVLATHPGLTEVRLRLLTRDATKVMRLDDRLRVTPSPALFADLKQLLGPGCLTG